MKARKSFAWIAVMFAAILCTGFLAACDEDGKKGGASVGTSYTITCTDGDFYEVSLSHNSAPEGTVVTVAVETEPYVQVEAVTANGTACTAGSGGSYTFTMPAENVTVSVSVKGAPESLHADSGMGWIFAPSQISLAGSADYQEPLQDFRVTFGTDAVLNNTADGNMLQVKVFSTNENVIPAEALSGVRAENVSGAYAYAASFEVDLTKVKAGTATLVLIDEQNDRFISREVAVVPYGDVYKNAAWQVTVTADFSEVSEKYMGRGLRIFLGEENDTYVYGSVYANATQFSSFTADDLQNGEFSATFYYIPNTGVSCEEKSYTIRIAYEGSNDVHDSVYFPLSIVNGVSENGAVSFSENGGSVSVVVGDPE